MLVYDTSSSTIKEVPITTDSPFQPGQSLCLWAAGLLFLIGGQDDGLLALKIDMSQATASRVLSPPYAVAYGFLSRVNDRMYLAGAVTHSRTGQMDLPAPVLTFNPYLGKWEALPPTPGNVALSGSFILFDSLYLVGGFVDFPTKPKPFDKVLRFAIKEAVWSQLSVQSPVRNALPSCVVLSDASVLIIGGFDPTEELGESFDVYRFHGDQFLLENPLPDLGERRFTDIPYFAHGKVYLISEDETLFTYTVASGEWTGVDLVEKLRKSISTDEHALRPQQISAGCLYHYLDSECAWMEFALDGTSAKRVEPIAFRSYVKHPGLAVLEDGWIVVAGGLKQTRDSREAVDSVWTLNPATKQTIDLMNLPKRQYGLRLVLFNSDIYAIAGITESEPGGRCQYYNPSTKDWKPLSAMLYPTQFPGVSVFRGLIYAVCGCAEVAEGAAAYNLIQVFTPGSNAWEVRRVEYPLGVKYLAVYTLDSVSLLCVGGVYGSNDPCNAVFLFNDIEFTKIESLPGTLTDKATTNFRDPPVRRGNRVFFVSVSGLMFVYDANSRTWASEAGLISNRL